MPFTTKALALYTVASERFPQIAAENVVNVCTFFAFTQTFHVAREIRNNIFKHHYVAISVKIIK